MSIYPVQCCWQTLLNRLSDPYAQFHFQSATSFLDLITVYLPRSSLDSICLAVVYKLTRDIWKQRNAKVYRGTPRSFNTTITLSKALHLLEASLLLAKGTE